MMKSDGWVGMSDMFTTLENQALEINADAL
jgi:hypothetical protein